MVKERSKQAVKWWGAGYDEESQPRLAGENSKKYTGKKRSSSSGTDGPSVTVYL
jgi:hypothetical protein